jgi:hypothetical protein
LLVRSSYHYITKCQSIISKSIHACKYRFVFLSFFTLSLFIYLSLTITIYFYRYINLIFSLPYTSLSPSTFIFFSPCLRLSGCNPASNPPGRLWPYVLIFCISAALAIVLRFEIQDAYSSSNSSSFSSDSYFRSILGVDDSCLDSSTCLGSLFVYIVSHGLFFFYLFHALLSQLHPICWAIDRFSYVFKVFFLLICLVISALIPSSYYFVFWVQFCRAVAPLFLIHQLILFVDTAHSVKEFLNNPSEEENAKLFDFLSLAISLILLIGSGILMVFCFIWFSSTSCGLNIFLIVLTIVCTLILIAISISEKFSAKGGLVPSSVVTIYSYYLLYSSLSSDPSSCNYFVNQSSSLAQIIIGLILLCAITSYAGYSAATSSFFEAPSPALSIPPSVSSDIEKGADSKDKSQSESKSQDDIVPFPRANDETYRNIARHSSYFHGVFCLCSVYLAMLLTDWGIGSSAYNNDSGAVNDASSYSYSTVNLWLKIASQWMTWILFLWSMIAPSILKNRDFS